jgi:hypothetical protein
MPLSGRSVASDHAAMVETGVDRSAERIGEYYAPSVRRFLIIATLATVAVAIALGMLVGQGVSVWSSAPSGYPSGGIVFERVSCGSAIAPTDIVLNDGFAYSGRSCSNLVSVRREIAGYGFLADVGTVAILALAFRRLRLSSGSDEEERVRTTSPIPAVPR